MFLKIIGVLFIIFMGLFIANISGYYESRIRNKVIITENGIKEFENKIKNGEEIDINSFFKSKEVDYSSPISRLGDHLTDNLLVVISKGGKFIKDIIKSLF